MKKIYGIKRGTTGVYLITNKLNGRRYVGSSVDISARLSTHFKRDCEKYKHNSLYSDILIYGLDGFNFEVLEECNRNELIEREQFYYDKLKPEYNIVRPDFCNFNNDEVRKRRLNACRTDDFRKMKSEQYKQEKYRKLFSDIQNKRKIKVSMYKESVFIMDFESLSECQRWLDENTNFKSKNKVSKIKSVCDGERKSAYGYIFKYKKTSND